MPRPPKPVLHQAKPKPRPPVVVAREGPIVGLAAPAGFAEQAAALGVVFEPGDVERLGVFLAMLLEANAVTNLTAITEPEQMWTKHILDALTLVPVLASIGSEGAAEVPGEEGKTWTSVIDIGSGGGVPAVPLAIVMPEVKFTMVESTGKKVEFLNAVIKELGLKNARVLQTRAEALGQDYRVHREKYDAAMARALGHLAVVAELCGPLVRPHGVVVAVKGARAEQELTESAKAFGLLGLRHLETVVTPTGRLVLLEKTTRTPKTYPRKDGEPARVPLGVAREK